MRKFGSAVSAIALLAWSASTAAAADAWTAKVVNTQPPFEQINAQLVPDTYTALDSSEVSRKWHVCFLIPHAENPYPLGVLYGGITEAQRLKAKLSAFSAGGYQNTPRQISQMEDCIAAGANAVVLMATSPGGLNNAIAEAVRKGVVVIDLVNGVTSTDIHARVVSSYARVGQHFGSYLAAKHPSGSGKVKVLFLAGPAGAPYVQHMHRGFYQAIAQSDIEVVKDLYGPTSKVEQAKLVEDGLLAYRDLNYIVGNANGLEAAVDSFKEKKITKIGLVSGFYTPGIEELVKSGEVMAGVSDAPVIQARMAVDMAIRFLEKKPWKVKDTAPDSFMIDGVSIKSVDRETSLAPVGWRPVWNVD